MAPRGSITGRRGDQTAVKAEKKARNQEAVMTVTRIDGNAGKGGNGRWIRIWRRTGESHVRTPTHRLLREVPETLVPRFTAQASPSSPVSMMGASWVDLVQDLSITSLCPLMFLTNFRANSPSSPLDRIDLRWQKMRVDLDSPLSTMVTQVNLFRISQVYDLSHRL